MLPKSLLGLFVFLPDIGDADTEKWSYLGKRLSA